MAQNRRRKGRRKGDNVNHPSHYNVGGIEVIDAIEAWGLGFHAGNTVKYVARAGHKGDEIEDLEKAQWYLKRRIENLKRQRREQEKARRRAAKRSKKRTQVVPKFRVTQRGRVPLKKRAA